MINIKSNEEKKTENKTKEDNKNNSNNNNNNNSKNEIDFPFGDYFGIWWCFSGNNKTQIEPPLSWVNYLSLPSGQILRCQESGQDFLARFLASIFRGK